MAAATLVMLTAIVSGSLVPADPIAANQPAATPAPAPTLEQQKLEAERSKLDAERRKAERDNEWFTRLLALAVPFLTVVVAAGTLVYTVRKGAEDLATQRSADATARREAAEKRFDDRFATAMTASASDKPAERRAGAVVIDSLIRDPNPETSGQGMNLLLALLQDLESREDDEGTRRVLRQALARRLRNDDARELASRHDFRHLSIPGIDLNGVAAGAIDLAYSDLSGGNLGRVDLAQSKGWKLGLAGARLNYARLKGAEWARADAPRSQFQDAFLPEANLWGADLTRADFFRADLRNANLRQALLAGARFNRAKIAGAEFRDAELDDAAMRSLILATGWETARFDSGVRAQLEDLAAERAAS